ncbi:TPA: hypothetical protein ACPYVY_005060, partial [Citrobacter freundii]
SHWSTSKTPSYTKSVSWQHHQRCHRRPIPSGRPIMVNNTELNILKLLASRDDVNWTWYNLDRAMSIRKMDGIGNVARLVSNLSEAGLVDIVPGTTGGMNYYRVSEKGHNLLNDINEQHLVDLP